MGKHGVLFTMTNKQEYFKKLLDRIFRLLPLYEGKDQTTKNIICSPGDAYSNFSNNLITVDTEIDGLMRDNIEDIEIQELSNLIKGMYEISIGEHNKVRVIVFAAIRLCKRIGGIE